LAGKRGLLKLRYDIYSDRAFSRELMGNQRYYTFKVKGLELDETRVFSRPHRNNRGQHDQEQKNQTCFHGGSKGGSGASGKLVPKKGGRGWVKFLLDDSFAKKTGGICIIGEPIWKTTTQRVKGL